MKNDDLTIYAGPCSFDSNKTEQYYQIANIFSKIGSEKQYKVWGTRVVGLKSRTSFNPETEFVGQDFDVLLQNEQNVLSRKGNSLSQYPSVEFSYELMKKTGISIATEIVYPELQLPLFAKLNFGNKLLIWNPAVVQLGWYVRMMAIYALQNGWQIGLKNGKWIGQKDKNLITSFEKTWTGMYEYASLKRQLNPILIHRGVDTEKERSERNIPVDSLANDIKEKLNAQLFLDPSHIFGGKLRSQIVEQTLERLKMKTKEGRYVYNGLLIETGESQTDTDQHITISELEKLIIEIEKFREIKHR